MPTPPDDFASPLDRRHDVRCDPRELARRRADPSARAVLLWGGRTLLTPEGFLALPPLAEVEPAGEELFYLGDYEGAALFAARLPEENAPPTPLAEWGTFEWVPRGASLLPGVGGELLYFAKALSHWSRRARFCGACGAPTAPSAGGHVRTCTSAACGVEHFPRTDPAVLVLPVLGDRCLMGRQASWPEGRYSALAGFVEPGESLEEAARRETYEETGVRLGRVDYFGSEPWPFPGSLMVGFFAQALNEEIVTDPLELEHARWFTRRELFDEAACGRLVLPRHTLSGRLIGHWADSE